MNAETAPGRPVKSLAEERRRLRCACGKPYTRKCDFELAGIARIAAGRRTCCAPLCDECAKTDARGRDLCAEHREEPKSVVREIVERGGGA